MLETIGTYLRRERELRNITLEEIFEHTHIKIEYLMAIESEHFEKIPGLTFAKGYLKAYASYIGLVPEEVLLLFEDFIEKLSGTTPVATSSSRRYLFWIFSFLLITIIVAGILLWLIK